MAKTWMFYGLIAVVLSNCAPRAAIQTSSGSQYLEETARQMDVLNDQGGGKWQAFQQAAGVEPILRFPAKIGVAMLDGTPVDHLPFKDMDNPWIGEFVPVSQLTSSLVNAFAWNKGPRQAEAWRLAAARQHLDALLLIDFTSRWDLENSFLAFVDFTIIGGAFLPTRHHHAESHAEAILFDVRNGYVYGSSSGTDIRNEMSGSWGAQAFSQNLRRQSQKAAYLALQDDLERMFAELGRALAENPEIPISEAVR